MTESVQRLRAKEPSHLDLINFIGGRFDSIEARLERGEKRFDRIEEKMAKADEVRLEMVSEISTVQSTVSSVQSTVSSMQANAGANAQPPWWLGWKPVAIALTLALFAGAGLTALAIAGLDIVPKLTAIKDAIQP